MSHAVARVRKGARVGGLNDALADPEFARTLLALMRQGTEVPTSSGGRLVFSPTSAMASMDAPVPNVTVTPLGEEQSNTSLRIGEDMILKAFRRLQQGVHPEVEVSRFLTESGYDNTPPLLGAVEMFDGRGVPTTLALLQGFVSNQGDGWNYTIDYLERYLEQAGVVAEDVEVGERPHAAYGQMAQTLGRRTAELHRAFAHGTNDPAFRAEPVTRDDLAAWAEAVAAQADAARRTLGRRRDDCPEDLALEIDELLETWPRVEKHIEALLASGLEATKTRYHGDYHLGQVIVVERDFYIIDFKGETAKPLSERRAKHSSLRDVAGMIRSFSGAAWAALFRATEDRAEDIETLLPLARNWEADSIAAFLEGYRQAIGGCPSYPDDPQVVQNLIDLFSLEKAMRQVNDETAHEPKWLRSPIQCIRELLESFRPRGAAHG
jgi:maltose alpha-D-glucosyltransferase/alpha-amylase